MANCMACGKWCGAKPVARCPKCPSTSPPPTPVLSPYEKGRVSSPAHAAQGGADASARLDEMSDALHQLIEAEDNLRAASVETFGRDIFMAPPPPPLPATSNEALVEGMMLATQDNSVSEERVESALSGAESAKARGDEVEAKRLIGVAAGYAAGHTLGICKLNEALRAQGIDPYGLMNEEDRQVAEAGDAMAARDWQRIEAAEAAGEQVRAEDLEMQQMFTTLFSNEG